ncbi:MAG: hypothetical protein PHP85_14575 [Gallionella sp.]|nr:hypothetical protein [Gallionella sp.]
MKQNNLSVIPPTRVDNAPNSMTDPADLNFAATALAPLTENDYTVLSPLNVDHTEYAVGEPIKLDDKTAIPLLAVKAIKLANPAPAKKAEE